MDRLLVGVGSVLGFFAVALGAFGTHGLRDQLSERAMAAWSTGVSYHLAHALGILLLGMLAAHSPRFRPAGWLFVLGVVIFSGTLYLYATTGTTAFVMITPLGGLCFLAGWAWSAWAALSNTGTAEPPAASG